LKWIQFSLQIIKRFEKENDFLIPIWQWVETHLEAEPGPTSFFFSSQFLRVAQLSRPSLTSIGTSPACLASPTRVACVRPNHFTVFSLTRYRPIIDPTR
jgi:hypothetical protein